MAFDATSGGASANSFCTVAEADGYLEDRYGAETWESFGGQTKEELLLDAAEILDALEWNGGPETNTQALQWPRVSVWDRFGNSIDDVPEVIKKAQAILAYMMGVNEWSDEESLVTDITVDGVTINGSRDRGLPKKVKRLISHLHTDRSYSAKVFRT